MPDVNYLAVAVAMVAAFVASTAWYIVFGRQRAELSAAAESTPPPWKIMAELARSFVVAVVLAGLAAKLDVATWTGALGLGLATWIGFPVVLLTGSVQWENAPWRLAAIHAGDWLVKLVLITMIVALWK